MISVGAKIKNLKVGDRVAMEPGATCRVCEDCKRGRYEVSHDLSRVSEAQTTPKAVSRHHFRGNTTVRWNAC